MDEPPADRNNDRHGDRRTGERPAMPSPSLKIEHLRYVLTLDPQRRIIRDGTILIEGGAITAVGKAAELADRPAERVIDGRRFLATPGFFNGHQHVSYAHAVRGVYPDDLPDRLVYVFRLQSAMTEEEEYWTTLLGLVELLRNGTTCFLDPGSTRFVDACLQAYQDAGIRVVMGEGVTDREAPVKVPRYETGEAVARGAAFIERYDGRLNGRLRAWAMPFSLETCSSDLLQRLKRLADDRGVGLTMHHHAGEEVQQHYLAEHGLRPTEYLESLGVLGPNVLLAHCLGIHDSEVAALARTGAAAVMCPVTAAKEWRGIHQVGRLPDLLAAGVPVALGTDSANSSNHLDLLRTMNMAALQYKDARQDPSMIPAETALELGTVTAARAFSLADRLGSLEPGKRADLLLFDTHRPEWQALHNPVNNLIYNADGRSVHTVLVDGRIVVENYQQTFVDESSLYARVQSIGESLLARTGIDFPRSRWPIE
jgi:cytosine/adenosine deaminase-related metal-dependent hydrolase